MLAGGTAGVAMWSVAIPPDVSLASHLKIWRSQGRSSEADELARTCLVRQTGEEMARNRECEVVVRRRIDIWGNVQRMLMTRLSNPDYNPLLKGHTPVSSTAPES